MILDDKELTERLESPLNLINRLREIQKSVSIPCLPPKSSDIIEGLDSKLNKSNMITKASEIMDACMDELGQRVKDAKGPKQLAEIAEKMSKVISNATANNNTGDDRGKIVIYAPQMITEEHFHMVEEKDVA